MRRSKDMAMADDLTGEAILEKGSGKTGKVVAVDFDGTCVTHAFPDVGNPIGAEPVLRELVGEGCRLMLWTVRSGYHLADAVAWFGNNGIPLFGVNENPGQDAWSDSDKAYADLYIDDLALGAPLVRPEDGGRPYVDWVEARRMLAESGFLPGRR